MVWEQNCASIVMLTGMVEQGVPKCHPYWPEETGEVRLQELPQRLSCGHLVGDDGAISLTRWAPLSGRVRR